MGNFNEASMDTEMENGNSGNSPALVASATIRENLRRDVRRSVENFLEWAGEEEIWVMREVLIEWDNGPSSKPGPVIHLAAAFLALIDRPPSAVL
jgi:hypothetical protein